MSTSGDFCDLLQNPALQEACFDRFARENSDRNHAILTILELVTGLAMYFIAVGYTMYEVGVTRTKNSKSVLFKVIIVIALSPLVWALWGLKLAGVNDMSTSKKQADVSINFWSSPEDFLQSVVLATVCGVFVSGAVAERMTFGAYSILQVVTIGIIYPLTIRNVISMEDDGWLWHLGFRDYAGGATVHMCSGSVALVSAWLLGPRTHRFGKSKNGNLIINDLRSNSPTFSSLGILFLAIGWLARLASFGTTETQASFAVANALIGVASSVFAAVIYHYWKHQVFSLEVMNTAALGSFVAITPCAGYIHVWAAVTIGLLSFLVTSTEPCCYVMYLLQIDDPCETIRVNIFNGVIGTVVGVGLFADAKLFPSHNIASPDNIVYSLKDDISVDGWFYGDADNDQFGVQLLGSLLIIIFSVIITFITCLCIIKCLGTMRVSLQDEILGLDVRYYNGYAVPELTEFHLRLDREMKKAQQKLKKRGVKQKPLEITAIGLQNKSSIASRKGFNRGISEYTNGDTSSQEMYNGMPGMLGSMSNYTHATNVDTPVTSSAKLMHDDDSDNDMEANVNDNFDDDYCGNDNYEEGKVVDDEENMERMIVAHLSNVPSHVKGAQQWADRLSVTNNNTSEAPGMTPYNDDHDLTNSMSKLRKSIVSIFKNEHDDDSTVETSSVEMSKSDDLHVQQLETNPIHSHRETG